LRAGHAARRSSAHKAESAALAARTSTRTVLVTGPLLLAAGLAGG